MSTVLLQLLPFDQFAEVLARSGTGRSTDCQNRPHRPKPGRLLPDRPADHGEYLNQTTIDFDPL